jgi:hypothetical protein
MERKRKRRIWRGWVKIKGGNWEMFFGGCYVASTLQKKKKFPKFQTRSPLVYFNRHGSRLELPQPLTAVHKVPIVRPPPHHSHILTNHAHMVRTWHPSIYLYEQPSASHATIFPQFSHFALKRKLFIHSFRLFFRSSCEGSL